MKKAFNIIEMTFLLLGLITFNVSCEKLEPEPEDFNMPIEGQETNIKEKLVGTWVHDYNSLPVYDTLFFYNDGRCSYIKGETDSDGISNITTCFYEFSGQFLILYNSLSDFNPYPHYIKFYDDFSYFVMYNFPFDMIDVVMNVGFRKID